MVAAGPEYGAVDSLYRSPLAEILPVAPTAQVIEEGYRPALTELGRRHPVTEGLEAEAPEGGWGRWFRLIEVEQVDGQVLMSGPGDRPLLVLNRVDEGRVAHDRRSLEQIRPFGVERRARRDPQRLRDPDPVEHGE